MLLKTVRLVCLCAIAGLAATPARAQSLGELAKRTQEQRDKAKAGDDKAKAGQPGAKDAPASKVYTDQDLKGLQPIVGGTVPVAEDASATDTKSENAPHKNDKNDKKIDGTSGKAAGPADKAADTGAEKEKEKPVVKDEAYWRARWTPVQAKLDADMSKALAAKTRVLALSKELQGIDPSNTRRASVDAERQRLIDEAQKLNDEIAADRAALAAIQDEGKRAGAPPAWFR